MNTRRELRAQLKHIERLEATIEQRIIQDLEPVVDLNTGEALNRENIARAIERLADKITTNPSIENPVIIGIMDGVFPFQSDLLKALDRRNYSYFYTTMQASSYKGTSSGALSIQFSPKIPLGNRSVILLDEVCDSGKTLKQIARLLNTPKKATETTPAQAKPKQIISMVLVDKKQERIDGIDPDETGFLVSKYAFIIGKGLDYDSLARNLDFIGAVKPSTLPTTEERGILNQKSVLLAMLAKQDAAHTITHNMHLLFSAKKARKASAIEHTTDLAARAANLEATIAGLNL